MGPAQKLLDACTLAAGRLGRATESGDSAQLEKAIEEAKKIPAFHDKTLAMAEVNPRADWLTKRTG